MLSFMSGLKNTDDEQENIKPIINYLFSNFRSRIDALSTRPFLRSFIQGLTTRWEQNNEPPPAPPPGEAESSKSMTNRAAEAEEDYFNASDEEEIGPKLPVKRKRMMTVGGGHSRKRSGGKLGLDYDDSSDSDGSAGGQSPHPNVQEESKTEPAITPSEVLQEDLGDVTQRMRAKRVREEEEEEGFVGMLLGKQPAAISMKEKEPEFGGGKRDGTPIKENHKLKLSFGGFGRKLGGSGIAR